MRIIEGSNEPKRPSRLPCALMTLSQLGPGQAVVRQYRQGSGAGNRAHRGAWRKVSVGPTALVGDADSGWAAGLKNHATAATRTRLLISGSKVRVLCAPTNYCSDLAPVSLCSNRPVTSSISRASSNGACLEMTLCVLIKVSVGR